MLNNKNDNNIIIISTRQSKGRLYPPFFRTFCFSLKLTGTLNLTQNCTLPLVKNGKIRITSCLIGNLNILGYMNML